MPISTFSTWSLYKRREGHSWTTDTTGPHHLGPKEPLKSSPKKASRSHKLFSPSKEDDVHQYVVRKPLNKEGKKLTTKVPKIQHLVAPYVIYHKWRISLKKQHMKYAAEYAKFLAKRIKKTKEKCQGQIAKRQGLSSLRASTFKSESSQK